MKSLLRLPLKFLPSFSVRTQYKRLKENFEYLKQIREMDVTKPCILVYYYIPLSSNKSNCWVDGFTEALDILNSEFEIIKLNLDSRRLRLNEINGFDVILVKSNWNWGPDNFLRKYLQDIKTKKAIMISGVAKPPTVDEMRFYDLLYYETEWYKPQIDLHPLKVHAFGINTSIMKTIIGMEKKYDWMTVGAFKKYKRQEMLLNKVGQKLAVGDYSSNNHIVRRLQREGVKVSNFVPYKKLAQMYNMSKNVYIPAEITGGGERAVLEARACGVPVYVENDNPKLLELLESDIWDHNYYASQLNKGFQLII